MLSTRQHGAAYVDVVKDGQTILTRDLDIENGQAALTLTATPEMAGTLDLHAYAFGANAQPIGDHRLVFVQPADELKIETTSDAQAYSRAPRRAPLPRNQLARPGCQRALGLQVVDEAVFALAEKQPGFAKVFFYLEQEAMKPRYEIHSLSMNDVVEPVPQSQVEQRNRAAQALFAATEMVKPNKLETEFGRTIPQEKRADYARRYQTAFLAQVRRLAARMSARHLQDADLTKDFSNLVSLDGVTPRDAWGTELRLEAVGWYTGNGRYYRIRSAGPDQQFDTADDLAVYIEVHSGSISRRPSTGMIDLKIEHDRGPFNGRAEVAGSVVDTSGAVIPAAKVEITPVTGGKAMNAVANASGQFALTSLPAGSYPSRNLLRGIRDCIARVFDPHRGTPAVLSATLAVGSTSQTVEVINRGFGFADGAFAVAGGAVGGMAHGVAGMPMAQAAMGGPIPIDGRNLIEMRALDSVTTVNVSAGNSALSTEGQRRVWARRSAPTSPRRSTSIRRSSPTAMALPVFLFRWQTPSPPGAWRCSPPPNAARWAAPHRASRSFRISLSTSTCLSPLHRAIACRSPLPSIILRPARGCQPQTPIGRLVHAHRRCS